MMWLALAGSCGNPTSHNAEDMWGCPLAVKMHPVVAVGLTLVHGAPTLRYMPLAPESTVAV